MDDAARGALPPSASTIFEVVPSLRTHPIIRMVLNSGLDQWSATQLHSERERGGGVGGKLPATHSRRPCRLRLLDLYARHLVLQLETRCNLTGPTWWHSFFCRSFGCGAEPSLYCVGSFWVSSGESGGGLFLPGSKMRSSIDLKLFANFFIYLILFLSHSHS